MKKHMVYGLLAVVALGLIVYGCGQVNSRGGSSSGDYTIQGKVTGVTVGGVSAKDASSVTHIVAAGSNSERFLATLGSDGSFSIGLNKGVPYALGFYNKTGTSITLLGYLKQNEVSWESLPLMNPTGTSTDLGNVTIEASSIEATPSIDLASLISKMNMVDQTNAAYYGTLDGPMAVFTNIDVDGNGIFDFQEDKTYLFSSYINVGGGTGQIANMQNGNYNTSYVPRPSSYALSITVAGDNQTVGSTVTFNCPQPVTTESGNTAQAISASVESTGGGEGWVCWSKINGEPIVSPEVTPSGTYTASVGGKTYTFNNYHASEIVKVGANDGIVYPVFNLVTDAAGYITTVNYKWQKLVNGATAEASADEVKAAIEDTALSTAYVHTSPFISFFSDAQTLIGSVKKFDRDGTSVDVSALSAKLSEVHHIQASYNLNSRVICKFDLY